MHTTSLRDHMTGRGMTVRGLAALLGVQPRTIQYYASGERIPDAITAEAIARRLTVQVHEIAWGRADVRVALLAAMQAGARDETRLGEMVIGQVLGVTPEVVTAELDHLAMLCDAVQLSDGWHAVE